MKTLLASTATDRPHRVSVTLYDEDLALVGTLQMYTGIMTRSAIIRFALRALKEQYHRDNTTLRDDAGREKS